MSPNLPPELSSFATPSEIFPFFVETIITVGILLSLVINCAQRHKKSETKQRGPTPTMKKQPEDVKIAKRSAVLTVK